MIRINLLTEAKAAAARKKTPLLPTGAKLNNMLFEEVKGYEDKKKNLEEKINLINQLKTNQKGPVRLMDEVSKALPDLVWLSNIEVAGNQITMRGKTLAIPAVATYVENLKRSPFFAEPVFRTLGLDSAGTGGSGVYSWEMNLTFKPSAALANTAGGTTSPEPIPAPAPAPRKK